MQHRELEIDIDCIPQECNVNFPINMMSLYPGVAQAASVADWYADASTAQYAKDMSEFVKEITDAVEIGEHNVGLVHNCTGTRQKEVCIAECGPGYIFKAACPGTTAAPGTDCETVKRIECEWSVEAQIVRVFKSKIQTRN